MSRSRDTYKYQFKVGNKIVHGGITSNLERRRNLGYHTSAVYRISATGEIPRFWARLPPEKEAVDCIYTEA